MFEVKKGVPIPPHNGGPWTSTNYPFATMEVGDCFDAPDNKGSRKNSASIMRLRICNSARYYTKRHNPAAKFTTRKVGNIIRCWRFV